MEYNTAFVRLICVFTFFIFAIGACRNDDFPDDPEEDEMQEEMEIEEMTDTTEVVVEANYLNLNSDFIFHQDSLYTFHINVSEESLAFLDDNPIAEEYVEASLIFNGDTLSPVGLRYKGSLGAFVNCLSGGDVFNPSGFKTCTKLSMKVKINWQNSSDKFYGLKKLQFHSMNIDPTQMRERLAYWLFQEMGVPAPRSVHARIMLNGEFLGLFALTEQIDGRFCNYHFDEGDGNLYKEIWPLNSQGNPHGSQYYIDAMKTNEESGAEGMMIQTFAEELKAASADQLQQFVLQNMDMSETLAMIAVDRTIRADDGPFHWYCFGGGCAPHNFYWYEDPAESKLHLIPWDMDNSFENIIYAQNPVTIIADEFGETSNNCQPFAHGGFGLYQTSASCDKLIGTWADFDSNYQQKLMELKNGPLSAAQADQMIDKWEALIENATLEADEKHNDALQFGQWQQALSLLRNQVNHARNN